MGKIKMHPEATARIHFEDNGQDFLWWDINDDDVVVDCGPFQASTWVGSEIIFLEEGKEPDFLSKFGYEHTLVHKVDRIEEKEVTHG